VSAVLHFITSNLSKVHVTRATAYQFLFADCPGLSPSILLQFTVDVCAAAENCRKITKTPYFGGSRSFKVINVELLKACQQLLLRLETSLSASTRRANSGKITTFYGGTPIWRPRAEAFLNLGGRNMNC